jgi:hypothetical protein
MYDISGVSTPEMRLLLCIMMTGMNCYNTNKLNSTMDSFLNEDIPKDIEERYANL